MTVRKFLYSSGGDLKQSATTDDLSVNTLTSGVATGTAPFTVASTTVVTNLNAEKLNGKSAPSGDIVGTSDSQTLTNKTLTSPVITTITGSSITLDSAADINLDAAGSDIVLKDTGTIFGSLSQVGGELVIKSGVTPTSAITMSGANVTIAGDLTVSGTTTTVDSNTVTIGDNIIVLNFDEAGTPSANAGIEIERGTSTNSSVTWNETSDKWTAGITGSEAVIILAGDNISDLTNDSSFIAAAGVTYENLSANSDIGTGSTQVSQGDHLHTLDAGSNVTITANATGELLKWNGSAWINNTLSEAGISATGHNHDASYFTETEIGSATTSSGSDLVGDDNTYSNFTPAAATVKGAFSGIDTALGAIVGSYLSATYTAGTGGIASKDAVYISANDTVLKADASGIATSRVIGISSGAISAAGTGPIVTEGLLTGVSTGWTAGGPVFLSETTGLLTQTAPTTSAAVILQVGIAKNATDLQIKIGTPIINS